jgi:hypothetical protein
METMMNKAEQQTLTNAVALALAEVNPSAGHLEGDEDNRIETRAIRLLTSCPSPRPAPHVWRGGESYNIKPVICTINCVQYDRPDMWGAPMTYSQDVSVMVNATSLLHDWGHYVMMTWSNQYEAVVHLI